MASSNHEGLILRGLKQDRRGSAAFEFALVVPIMLTVLFGILQFGITLGNNLTLLDATRAGAREMAVARSSATPYDSTVTRFRNSAPGLAANNTTLKMFVNGSECKTNSECQAKLTTATGQPVTLDARYPCDLNVFGVDLAPNCMLVSTTSQRVE